MIQKKIILDYRKDKFILHWCIEIQSTTKPCSLFLPINRVLSNVYFRTTKTRSSICFGQIEKLYFCVSDRKNNIYLFYLLLLLFVHLLP